MPCRPAEDDISINPGHGYVAATLLIWVCDRIRRDPPIWAFDIALNGRSTDARPTRFLCRLMGGLPVETAAALTRDASDQKSRELAKWWKEHQAFDERRKAQGED